MGEDYACAKCGVFIATGSSHLNADACIEALRAALECASCEEPLGEYCTKCSIKKAALNKAGQIGMSWFQKAQEHFIRPEGGSKKRRRDHGD